MGQFQEALSLDLTLYVRQYAWLNTAPDKAEGDKSKTPEKSRLERMQAEGIEHELPPCDAAYLADYLWEIGPSLPAGMGAGPITHSEIASWQHNTGIELNSWESRTLRKLSITYLNESHKAKDRKCPAPWGESHAVTNLEAATLKNSIRALAEL